MIEVKNVQLEVLNDKVRVTGRLNFGPNEVGKKYRVKIEIFPDDTGEGQTTFGPLYTFRFGETQILNVGEIYALYKTVTGAPTVNINETDNLDTKKLDEDPGVHLKQTPNGPIPLPNIDEIFAVISVLPLTGSTTAIAKGKSGIVTGVFA